VDFACTVFYIVCLILLSLGPCVRMLQVSKLLSMDACHDLHGSCVDPCARKLQRAVSYPVGPERLSKVPPTLPLSRAHSQSPPALCGNDEPPTHSCCEDFLKACGLEQHAQAAGKWCTDMGAAFLAEVLQHLDEFADALSLTQLERSRLLDCGRSFLATTSAKKEPRSIADVQAEDMMARKKRMPRICPNCSRGERVVSDVTIGAQHSFWGGKWNECSYTCRECERPIPAGQPVIVCQACQLFWHEDCNISWKPREPCMHVQAKKVTEVNWIYHRPSKPSKHMPAIGNTSRRTALSQYVASSMLPTTTKLPLPADATMRSKEVPASALTRLEQLVEDTEPLPSQGERWQTCKRPKRHRRQARCTKLKLLRARIPVPEELVHPFAAELAEERLARDEKPYKSRYPSSFEAFRRDFLERYGPAIKANLSAKSCGSLTLRPAPVSREVQNRFIEECAETRAGDVVPAYHGSEATNYDSICERGLLIPGRGNELAIVHGAAHGRGIYTASVDAPSLSMSFCTEPKLLVCGVLDDSLDLMPEQESCGQFLVGARSQSIKHVGDAIVVFNERRVVPLFEAAADQFLPYQAARWQRQRQGAQPVISVSAWLGASAPHCTSSASLQASKQSVVRLSKGKAYHVASHQYAFMPPKGESCWIPQKRVYEAKVRDQRRRHCRREKAMMMS